MILVKDRGNSSLWRELFDANWRPINLSVGKRIILSIHNDHPFGRALFCARATAFTQ
jgi:hypothetical protein